MKTEVLAFFMAVVALATSCKTAEDIRRDKLVDTHDAQMRHFQEKFSSNSHLLQEHQDRLNQMYGQFEEQQHQERQRLEQEGQERAAALQEMASTLAQLQERMDTVEKNQKEQARFIKMATAHLKDMAKKRSKPKKKKSSYQKAMGLLDKGQHAKAERLFLQVLGQKNLRPSRWVRTHHGLGLINYRKKKYEQAMIHMSKVYTKYPRSSKAPSALFTIAQCFLKQGKVQEGREALKQLATQYPKEKKLVQKAKNILQR